MNDNLSIFLDALQKQAQGNGAQSYLDPLAAVLSAPAANFSPNGLAGALLGQLTGTNYGKAPPGAVNNAAPYAVPADPRLRLSPIVRDSHYSNSLSIPSEVPDISTNRRLMEQFVGPTGGGSL